MTSLSSKPSGTLRTIGLAVHGPAARSISASTVISSRTSGSAGSDTETEEELSDDEHTLVGFGDVSLSTIDSIPTAKPNKSSGTGSIRRSRPLPPGRRSLKGKPSGGAHTAIPQNIPKRQTSSPSSARSRALSRATNRIPVPDNKTAHMSQQMLQEIYYASKPSASVRGDFESMVNAWKQVRNRSTAVRMSGYLDVEQVAEQSE